MDQDLQNYLPDKRFLQAFKMWVVCNFFMSPGFIQTFKFNIHWIDLAICKVLDNQWGFQFLLLICCITCPHYHLSSERLVHFRSFLNILLHCALKYEGGWVGKGEGGFKEKVKSVGISKSIILEMPAFLIVHIEALSPGCISDNRVFISICASAAAAFIVVATWALLLHYIYLANDRLHFVLLQFCPAH